MSTSRSIAWAMWFITSIFYAYQYILRVMPNIMMADILQQFSIDTLTFGQFSGVYYVGYSLMHLPIGIMLDRFGPKKILPICIIMTVIGLLPIIFAEYWIYPILGRALIGMGSSAAILGSFKVIRLTFNENRFTGMLSLTTAIGLIGAIYGGGPVSYLCATMGYKAVVTCFAIMGLILATATYFIVPNIKSTPNTTVLSDIREVFSTPKVIIVCLLAGLMVGPLEGFADVWGTAFLKKAYGCDDTFAASLPSLIYIGMCFGSPLLSFVAEKSNSYFGTIIAAAVIMALSFFALIFNYTTISSMGVMFIAIGVCSAYQILAIYKASTYVKEHVVGLTTAVANMIIMIFGYAFHSAIGGIIEIMGGPHTLEAFTLGISVVPVTLTIGAIGFIALVLYERLTFQPSAELVGA
ncbi:MFS transporter [Candidatus Paracaedibacter symbiosus]|uniref:MFS transporter n=1 Tax=Candidatus Paracaedibacter symbiosus TaxID=244582 RepID=UPI000509F000|nr:MFS transporter [Candidatus Paracaedibacter symbiosus]